MTTVNIVPAIPFRALLDAELRKTVSTRAGKSVLATDLAITLAAEAAPLIFTQERHPGPRLFPHLGGARPVPAAASRAADGDDRGVEPANRADHVHSGAPPRAAPWSR